MKRGKLDALLALAEATDCRRARLLAYFGETMPSRSAAKSTAIATNSIAANAVSTGLSAVSPSGL